MHLHSPNASRTILSNKGGYTVVEGERCDATRGDLILTPNGTWHDHGNDSNEPVIWIDMLDWPLMEFLDCAWVDQEFKPGSGSNAKSQETVHKDGYSGSLYGHGVSPVKSGRLSPFAWRYSGSPLCLQSRLDCVAGGIPR